MRGTWAAVSLLGGCAALEGRIDDVEGRVTALEDATPWETRVSDAAAAAGAVAGDLEDVEDDLDELDARVGALEASLRSVALPASAFSYLPGSAVTRPDHSGVLWSASFFNGATLTVPAPADYAGGDVTLRLVFETTTGSSGLVRFFARPRSVSSGDLWVDGVGLDAAGVSVAGASRIHEDAIVLPATALDAPIWLLTLQRGGAGETYPDDVRFRGASLEYAAR